MEGEVVASGAELGGHRGPEGREGLGGEEEEAGREGGEAGRGLARPARPQLPTPPPQHQRPDPEPQLGQGVQDQPKEGEAAGPAEGGEDPPVKELVRQGVEELAEEGGALPPGRPPVQDVRGHPQEEEGQGGARPLGEHRPHQGAQEEEAGRGQGVCQRHKAMVRDGTVKIMASRL